MQQQYFIVVLAHSLHGRLRRIHIPQRLIYVVLALALLGCFSLFGFVSSYMRMAFKVANYNSLRQEIEFLRARYQNLQKSADQTNDQLATLQLFASQVSVAYGIKAKLEGPSDISIEGRLVPTYRETLEEYSFLTNNHVRRPFRSYTSRFQVNVRPSIWPVMGRLQSAWGMRIDPFSGEGTFHRGVDIVAPQGTSVRAAADGEVRYVGWSSGYGRLVIIDHGRGIQTYYAHLFRFSVIPGQEVRRGEVIGAVGSSGRATAAHLHYEVRVGGNPVNPHAYMRATGAAMVAQTERQDLPF